MASFHPLDFGQWMAYLSYVEQKIRCKTSSDADDSIDLKTAYSSFLSHFPTSSSAWIRLSKLQATATERLATLNTAVGSCKYSPSLWHELLIACMPLGSRQEDSALGADDFPRIASRTARDALFHVGAHPESRDLWNLIIDSELVPAGEIMNFLAVTLPRFTSDLINRMHKTSTHIQRSSSAPDQESAAVVALAEAVWTAREAFEATVSIREFEGKPSGNEVVLSWVRYIDFEISELSVQQKDSMKTAKPIGLEQWNRVRLIFERAIMACPDVLELWQKYAYWLWRTGDSQQALAVSYRAVVGTQKLNPIAHLHYACLLEASGSIEAADAVLTMLVQSPGGCGALSLPAHLARSLFEQRRGRLDVSRNCLDTAQAVFERQGLVAETHAVVVKKVEFLSMIHPGDLSKAWQELIEYRPVENMFQCDDDLPLLRAAYALALRFATREPHGPDGDSFDSHAMILTLFTAALSVIIKPPSSMDRSRTPHGSALPAILELVDHYIYGHCASSETAMHLKDLANQARFMLMSINM